MSVFDGWGCVLSLLFGLRPPPETPRMPDSFLLAPGERKVLLVPSQSLFPQSCGRSLIKPHWPPKSNPLEVLSPFTGSPGWGICCGS